ncbi:sensor histidine kinase [Undibacterium squillarum]|uniref:Histidine kinase n=1 Tax=Undibacterium squillarum TaxID=1131567 RepID=A0ABQ2XUN5_9BURK|nr:histidine kinase [Undibacterium squillarum]GGX31895.1 histidine kinase [Undibacterium squillarum]
MKKFWGAYALVWTLYAFTVSFALITEEQVSIASVSFLRNMLLMLPAPFLLALIWPLSAYMQKQRWQVQTMVAVHVVGAISYAYIPGLFYLVLWRLGASEADPSARLFSFWPTLYNGMMYLTHALVFHGIRIHRQRVQQDLALEQTRRLLISTELNALRNKLNPHFLFNTLHSIIALVRKDQQAAESALFRFSDMLRYILDTEKSGHDRVTLEEELQFVRDYLALEGLRLGARLQVEWDVDDSCTGVSLPALIIQPLVENSIRHAFNPRSQPGLLTIRCYPDASAQCLRVEVRDNGPGCDPQQIAQAAGMGMRTIQRRLALEFGDAAAWTVSTAPGAGMSVAFSVPLETASS